MSLPPPAYLAEVERVFVAQAGRGLLLSPADRELVARFARAGVPVGVVVEGIERAFAHDPPRRVRSLRYAEPAIEAAVAAWRWRQAGAGPVGPAPDAQVALVAAFAELLDRIAAGRRQGDAPQTAAVDRVWQAVDALRGRFAAGAEADPIAALMRLEDELT
ncbi:MAG: hypothetical protein KC620_13130, partial [Myxococcales bacterium]|nr:hypothetical protein [Myxococcales bacterium]